MKNTNVRHSVKQQQQQNDENEQKKVMEVPHKLIDAPPYSSIYMTSHGLEAPTRKQKKPPWSHKSYGGDEDIDAEAEMFIQLKHKRFLLSNYTMPPGTKEA